MKSKKKIKTDNQLKNMSKKISTKYLSIAHVNQIHAMNNHDILTNGKEKKAEEYN